MNQTKKNDEILIDGLFDLLYRRMWIPRYDPRNSELYAAYRQRMLALVRELSRAEPHDCESGTPDRIVGLTRQAAEDVRALAAAKVIPAAEVVKALELFLRIAGEVESV